MPLWLAIATGVFMARGTWCTATTVPLTMFASKCAFPISVNIAYKIDANADAANCTTAAPLTWDVSISQLGEPTGEGLSPPPERTKPLPRVCTTSWKILAPGSELRKNWVVSEQAQDQEWYYSAHLTNPDGTTYSLTHVEGASLRSADAQQPCYPPEPEECVWWRQVGVQVGVPCEASPWLLCTRDGMPPYPPNTQSPLLDWILTGDGRLDLMGSAEVPAGLDSPQAILDCPGYEPHDNPSPGPLSASQMDVLVENTCAQPINVAIKFYGYSGHVCAVAIDDGKIDDICVTPWWRIGPEQTALVETLPFDQAWWDGGRVPYYSQDWSLLEVSAHVADHHDGNASTQLQWLSNTSDAYVWQKTVSPLGDYSDVDEAFKGTVWAPVLKTAPYRFDPKPDPAGSAEVLAIEDVTYLWEPALQGNVQVRCRRLCCEAADVAADWIHCELEWLAGTRASQPAVECLTSVPSLCSDCRWVSTWMF